jgi:hypothetical protein
MNLVRLLARVDGPGKIGFAAENEAGLIKRSILRVPAPFGYCVSNLAFGSVAYYRAASIIKVCACTKATWYRIATRAAFVI